MMMMLQPFSFDGFTTLCQSCHMSVKEVAPNDKWINLYGKGPGWIYVDQPEDGMRWKMGGPGMEWMYFLCFNGDYPIKNGDFPITNGDFPIKNGDALH